MSEQHRISSIPEPEPTPVEPLTELPPVTDDTANHSMHIRDLGRRMRKMEQSRPHLIREVQRMIASGFMILDQKLLGKWEQLDKVVMVNDKQINLLQQIKGGIVMLGILIPALWALYTHFWPIK